MDTEKAIKTYGKNYREALKIAEFDDISAKHVKFIRHSDLSDGPAYHDEVIRK